MGRPKVFLGMPNFGPMQPDCAAAWYTPGWAANRKSIDLVERREIRQSSIVGSFNWLFGRALDLRDQGKVTHFAMCHNDVEPPSWWIDDLYAIQQQRSAVLVSAIVEIKSHERLDVSCGAARRDDPYERRRFTLDELAALPVTFGNEHLPPEEFLLINTGLWIADIRSPVWDDFVFTQSGRFGRNEAGERVWQLLPEDWELSRWLTERNLPYLATRAVKPKHHGPDWWIVP